MGGSKVILLLLAVLVAIRGNAQLRDAVSKLPHGYRSVLELCDLQELSAREAALRLGLTAAAVKIRRHRGRRRLRPLMARARRRTSR